MGFLTNIYFFFSSIPFKYKGDNFLFFPYNYIQFLFSKFLFVKNWDRHGDRHLFFSSAYGEYFNHFRQYWQIVGKKSALIEILQRRKNVRIVGHTWKESLAKFSRSEYPDTATVIFSDIDRGALPRLLKLLGDEARLAFNEDVVCIPCANRETAKKILKATPRSMADAFVAQDGVIIYDQGDFGSGGLELL